MAVVLELAAEQIAAVVADMELVPGTVAVAETVVAVDIAVVAGTVVGLLHIAPGIREEYH